MKRDHREPPSRHNQSSGAGGHGSNTASSSGKTNSWGGWDRDKAGGASASGQAVRIMSRDSNPTISYDYGVVVSVKDTFGFVQPFQKEEQLYFSLRDVNTDIVVGDEVSYRERLSSRGCNAEHLRLVPADSIIRERKVSGLVIREPDMHKHVPGCLQLTASKDESGKEGDSFVVFLPDSSRSAKRIVKGDEIEVTIHEIKGTSYSVGKDPRIVRTKHARQLALQVQRLLDAGAVRELGVVDTIRGDFGFIKPQDRREQIYFKLSDVSESDTELREGVTEFSFFVILENSKGKMCHRAMHIEVVPVGTVQFEVVLAVGVLGTVVAEPSKPANGREVPGRIKLKEPLDIGSSNVQSGESASAEAGTESVEKGQVIHEIELWARCLPEGLVCKVGDVLAFDVNKFRPERVIFARSVQVHSYRRLGREKGTICSVRDQGYGFIKTSVGRDHDLYFRTSEVMGETGVLLKERDVSENLVVSFDVVTDDSISRSPSSPGLGLAGSSRLRALRVRVEPATRAQQDETESIEYPLLKSGVIGIVVKDAKKDSLGVIRPTSDLSDVDDAAKLPTDIMEALEEFVALAEWKEVRLESMQSSQRRLLHSTLLARFPGIAHETIEIVSKDGSKLRSMRLWKLSAEEFEKWNSQRSARTEAAASANPQQKSNKIYFISSHVSEEFGLVSKDLEVQFDLHLDRKTNKRIGKVIRLTDYALPQLANPSFGVVEELTALKSGQFGSLRVVPSSEKLFWHSSGLADSTLSLALKSEVSFEFRLRGGLRCASGISLLAAGTLGAPDVLEGDVLGLVVESNAVVPLDLRHCPTLHRHYFDSSFTNQFIDGFSTPNSVAKESEGDSPAGASAVDGAAKGSIASAEEDIVIKGPNYFGVMSRRPIPIGGGSELFAPGTLVRCNAVMNWTQQRDPVAVVNVVPIDPKPIVKKRGSVCRVKIFKSNFMGSVELCEIKEVVDASSSNGLAFFSDVRDILRPDCPSPMPAVQLAEAVDFYPVGLEDGFNLAVAVVVTPKSLADTGISFKRSVNSTLKDTLIKRGFKGISMAQGPPDDGVSIGFAAGWRDPVTLDELPWRHLLQFR